MGVRENLVFSWKATFTDGSEIEQFDSEGNETLFKEVLDDIDNLELFSISDGEDVYEVDLVNKFIDTPHKDYKLKGKNPELIYFRRNSVRLEVGGNGVLPPRVVHHIGLRTNSEEKKLEVFAGQDARPKEVKFNDVKEKKVKDVTKLKK